MAPLPTSSATLLLLIVTAAGSAFAQGTTPPSVTLPPVIVTAQKEPADVRTVPASVTAVTGDTIANAGVRVVNDAAIYAPNTFFSDFTARKVSNARFRGIGASPANPAITTYIDGVPQLNANSSNIEFLDVDQIEFVRGPQSPLFGRNTLGGLINITSAKPALDSWRGSVVAPFGNFGSKELRGGVSGPLSERVGLSFSIGKQARDGYTVNDVTGNDLDSRDGTFAKAQVLWQPAQNWETRVIYTHERNRDGDYALGDLAAIRQRPFHVSRNFEGFTNRDINGATILLRGDGERVALRSSTGFLSWKTEDQTDLDYTAQPFATRQNLEDDFQFTQELRVTSPSNAPMQLTDSLTLAWQAGVALFKQNYDQLVVNSLAPFVLNPQIPFATAQTSPDAEINSTGVGLFGHGTLTVGEKTDVTLGLRFDHESATAALLSFVTPAIPGISAASVNDEASFSDVSPQVAVAYRVSSVHMIYGSAARGYKAGGYNPISVPGSESYGEEHAWHIEGGLKSLAANGRVSASAAMFYIDWDDLQLNVPNQLQRGQFYIANAGRARSRGVEFDVNARVHPSVDVFGTFGYTNARFGEGSRALGNGVADKKIPFTPDFTALFGAQISRAMTSALSIYGRAEAAFYGDFHYDEFNSAGQDAYSLANLRAGVRGSHAFAEAWIKNAYDTRFIPIAIPFPGAPSGFIGENGRPRTFGVSAGVMF
ncbi:MAG: TonB-dependent receptor [Vicinamibacterales bacterium]